MKWKKFLPFIILILPLLFLYLGISYHDSSYYVISAAALILLILLAVPNLLSNRHIYLKIPSFKAKKEGSHKTSFHETRFRRRPAHINLSNPKEFLMLFIRSTFFFIFLGFAVLFTYFSVFRLPYSPYGNFLISYYRSYFDFTKANGVLIVFLLAVIVAAVTFLKDKLSKKGLVSDYPKSKVRIVALLLITFVLAFNLSIITTFIFGIGEANLLALRIKSSPGSVGIIWGKDKVLQKLKGMNNSPTVTEGGKNLSGKVILLETENDNSRSRYYTQFILPNIPSNLVVSPGIPNEPLVIFRDNLIINSLDKDQMEAISPTLAKLMVKKYFGSRYIKDEPKIQVLGRQDYLKFREDQINNQLAGIDKLIQAATDIINTIYGNIANDKAKIAYNQNGLSASSAQKDTDYNYCISAGYTDYYYGITYHYYTQQQCDSQNAQWDQTIAGWQKNISDWQTQLQYDQSQLPQYQDAKDTLTAYRGLIASQKDTTPQELGITDGKDGSIKIALDFTGSKSIPEYLETLSHEFLHYTSYVSDERTLPSFFEEGFTEYYARHIIKQQLGQDTNYGYPLLEKIIYQMAAKIPDSTIQDIYFNKNQDELQSVLDATYGKDFYKNSLYYFNVMSLVPSKDALKMANNIMLKIGGKPLNENDLESTLPEVN